MAKTYTQNEVNRMSEKRVNDLFERGAIDDDMVQRWWDNKAEGEDLAADFIKNELPFIS